ncbi:sucrose synthase [Raphidocelis subcapitata]|uniref:sucrose synthase n=1 Tax=Raphidocelis subcapitata TaxID=307507 RepID=A0A2V0PKS8_9CHLO|nr:sucrose synthase [Raphidocelis subcapitata]|eukprot:GBF98480.1 sucrose synthase [Raphidocelis subcapitata]
MGRTAGGGGGGGAAAGAAGGPLPLALLCASALLLRLLVGLSPYSGAAHPPKYGDYEAQRHWMEITAHTPAAEWYTDGPHNHPSYWPLDYPPLSGYQASRGAAALRGGALTGDAAAVSWLHGRLVSAFEPQAVALGTSAGYETPSSKALLRWTVVLSDAALFFPAALLAARLLQPRGSGGAAARCNELFAAAALLLNPAHVLIDHGHFQYNCISLGLALGAAVAIAARGAHVLGSVLFCAALSHKQMSLFYAPAFFAHLLGRCLERPGAARKAAAVSVLGITVLASFAVMWAPYLGSWASLVQVLSRIFPVRRGLYEDYLANWWCVTSVAVKWKALASGPLLMRVCAALTLLAAAPSMAQQILAPSPQGLLLGMANSGFAFFMFGYQVHEKSILLPLLPITALAAWEPVAALWAPLAAAFSMFPLLERDGVGAAYAACLAIHAAVMLQLWPRGASGGKGRPAGEAWPDRALRVGIACGAAAAAVLHAVRITVVAPARLPWLHDRLAVSLAFVFVAGGMAYFNWRQWNQPHNGEISGSEKKKASDLTAARASGVDIYDVKFNIISPGADADIYFPHTDAERRLTSLHADLKELVWGAAEAPLAVSTLADPSKPVLFSMARLDRVKNLTGLVDWYGRSARLRAAANLVIVGGVLDPSHTGDREEAAECEKMHALIDRHGLRGSIRWIVAQKNRVRNGELYRMIADSRGAFVQPALYEAFGLTVVEAMACGLPTFATAHGGPSEIIVHSRSGYHIDPYHGDAAAELMADFFERCQEHPGQWDRISEAGLARIRAHYTWEIYAGRLLTLSSVYSFWKRVSNLDRAETKRYLEALYVLKMRPLIEKVPLQADTEEEAPLTPTSPQPKHFF